MASELLLLANATNVPSMAIANARPTPTGILDVRDAMKIQVGAIMIALTITKKI